MERMGMCFGIFLPGRHQLHHHDLGADVSRHRETLLGPKDGGCRLRALGRSNRRERAGRHPVGYGIRPATQASDDDYVAVDHRDDVRAIVRPEQSLPPGGTVLRGWRTAQSRRIGRG